MIARINLSQYIIPFIYSHFIFPNHIFNIHNLVLFISFLLFIVLKFHIPCNALFFLVYYFLHQFLGKIRETHTLFFVDNIVADFHTALLTNGVYINTATQRSKDGDVHLATEAIPLTYIMSRIGGLSHDGKVNIQTKPFPTSRNISRKTSFISCSSKNMNLLLDILNPVLLTFD